jgi:NADH:ubiquinone oxidoreductase subunit 4 (subunit M)
MPVRRERPGSTASTSATPGLDGISLWFVPLTAFITVIVVMAGWVVIQKRVAQYMGAFLILSGIMIGVFSRWTDAVLLLRSDLIPMYIIIGVWGGDNRVYAAFKFFLYTLLGSLLMLVALIYLYTCPAAASTSRPGTSAAVDAEQKICSSPSWPPSP